MLSEARNELDDFVHSSKELEEELLRELERTEKTQKDLKDKISRAEYDRDDWKVCSARLFSLWPCRMSDAISQNKFISLQTTHNTTVNSLHRELDTLRQDYQKLKVKFRDLELGNDDLERTERAISSSLADTEAKYAKALEEKILLEQELLNKAGVEEEAQRLRDELRDANSEVQVLRDQLDHYKTSRNSLMTPPATDSSCSPRHDNSSMVNLPSATNDDQLLDTTVPKDVLLADEVSPSIVPPLRSSRKISISSSGSSQRPSNGVLLKPGIAGRVTTPGIHSRSNSLRASPTKPTVNLSSPRTPRAGANSRLTQPSKSKGVQMVSEMRAKVRNLEQKLHTRVPRLRSGPSERSPLSGTPSNTAPTRPSQLDSPGWVLVMEETPPSRRVAPRGKISPPPTAFPTKGGQPNEDSPSHNRIIGPRRSFTKSRSSIPTPSTSRPGSPDFNPPLPAETRSMNALKRTSVPAFSYSGRTSFGSSTDSREGSLSTSHRSTTTVRGVMAPPPIPASKPLSTSALGYPTKFSSSTSSKTSLGTSRIGRPMSLSARRTDTGPAVKSLPVDEMGVTTTGRLRSYRSGSISQFGADGETF